MPERQNAGVHQVMALALVAGLSGFGLYLGVSLTQSVLVGLIAAAVWVAWLLRTEYIGGEAGVE